MYARSAEDEPLLMVMQNDSQARLHFAGGCSGSLMVAGVSTFWLFLISSQQDDRRHFDSRRLCVVDTSADEAEAAKDSTLPTQRRHSEHH